MATLCQELQNEKNDQPVRQSAGLMMKNALVAKVFSLLFRTLKDKTNCQLDGWQ